MTSYPFYSSRGLSLLMLMLITIATSAYSQRQGRYKVGEGGKIVGGNIKLKCTKPSKRYARAVNAAVDGSMKALDTVSVNRLTATVKTEIIRLTDYSQQGVDMDLIMFRLCQMGNNRLLEPGQIQTLLSEAMKTWNSRMTIKEQKNVIAQLGVELQSNLKTVNEIKKNTETILSTMNLLSGSALLRNEKIKILPLLFPKENLDKDPSHTVRELIEKAMQGYTEQHLDTNKLEQYKFGEAAKAIALTLEKTIPTFASLADTDGKRYPVYQQIWDTHSAKLSEIEVFDVTKFQLTYAELHTLKSNFKVIGDRALDYFKDLQTFFGRNPLHIDATDLMKVLTSERLAYDLITTYSKSLLSNVEALTKLQAAVEEVSK